MPPGATFETFEKELNRLVGIFGKNFPHYQQPGYDEASLRQEFLNPFFAALGWDVENKLGAIPKHREVEVESRTRIGGRQRRADYLFRAAGRDRFVCEAKKPSEKLDSKYAFQAKRYAWNKDLPLAILTDFEELKIYIVGGRPRADEPHIGEWRTWHYSQFPAAAQDLWKLLSRDGTAGGSIDALIESLPKRPAGKGKARQQWLIKPDRSRALDADFLAFLDEARRSLASDLYKHNDHFGRLADNRLNEAVQRILDRILFIRICEDRDIDTGELLHTLVQKWRKHSGSEAGVKPRQIVFEPDALREEPPAGFGADGINAPPDSLWRRVVEHFRHLDHRPPRHVPYFNGNLFKPHFSESLVVSDEWIAGFIGELSDDETPYLFNVMPVEILGSVYERFLGKVVRPHGRGVTVEEKPEVRKAGGVYYTPRYIVDYIVAQTVGKLCSDIAGMSSSSQADPARLTVPPHPDPHPPGDGRGEGESPRPPVTLRDFERRTAALRVLDPACGSGSFLIRAFERLCEHWQQWLTAHPDDRKKKLCWVDADTGDIHLTVDLKRRILTQNIYGVDLDSAAVEVTQLSLYLKMLEGENRTTLERERELFAGTAALLPPLQDNIKCGNSLIASDFSMIPEDLLRVNAFDWPVQFEAIMKAGGFDAVIGNPPYIRIQTMQESDASTVLHFKQRYRTAAKGNYDIYVLFVERSLDLIRKDGRAGFILPNKFLNAEYGAPLREMLGSGHHLDELVHFGANQVFEGATTYTCLLFVTRACSETFVFKRVDALKDWEVNRAAESATLPSAKLAGGAWSFSAGAGAALIERLKAMPSKLGEAADIFVGLQTSADDVFIMDFVSETARLLTLRSEASEAEITVEKTLFHPMVSGTDVHPYCELPKRQFVLFPYTVSDEAVELIPFVEIERNSPRTAAYLLHHRSRLSMREKGRMRGSDWYGYIYLKNMRRQALPKVCVPRLVDRLCAAYDGNGTRYLDNVDVGGVTWKAGYEKHDLRYLLALLNSRLLGWFFPNVSAPFRGGWYSANRQFLSLLPFRPIDFTDKSDRARHDNLVALVDKMLALTPKLRAATADSEKATLQNAVTATDRQIDALVYELYGLTPDEIELVEGGR